MLFTTHLSQGIKLFLGNGGDTQQGQLLFHALDRESEVLEVLTLLLKEGAPWNATMYQYHPFSWSLYAFMGLGTILHKATELGKVDVVRFLVHEGVDLSTKDANDDTALDCARRLSKAEVIQLLEDSSNHYLILEEGAFGSRYYFLKITDPGFIER